MMTRKHPLFRTVSRGFTLVESIIVLVMLGLAAATIATMSGNLSSRQTENQDWQIGLKLMQECAEHFLAKRRATANFSTFVPSCTDLPALPSNLTARGFSNATATPTDPYTSTGCPSGRTCKLVTVTVAMPAGGGNLTPLTLLLVPY